MGKTLGNTAAGAIAGAAVGGTVGAIIGRNMDNKAREIQEDLEGVTVQRVEEGIALTFDNGILFGFDSSALQTAGQENLEQLARIIDQDDETIVMDFFSCQQAGNLEWLSPLVGESQETM